MKDNTIFISEWSKYAVIKRDKVNRNHLYTVLATFETLPDVIATDPMDTVYIDTVNTYEIYTKNPDTLEGGWDIKFVESCDLCIKNYPLFDCIITRNDCTTNKTEPFFDPNATE